MNSDTKQFPEFQTNNSIDKITQLSRAYIKKSYIYVDSNNAYCIYGIHKLLNDEEYDPIAIFYIAEYSDQCARKHCWGDCRQFKLFASDTQVKEKNENFENNIFLEFDRPKRCTCCCFKRPEMFVNLKTNNSTLYIGRIVMPFKFCYNTMQIEAYDSNNYLKYKMKDGCCKCILICGGLTCKKTCKEDYLKLYDKNQQELKPIKSKAYDCEQSCQFGINDKIIDFPYASQAKDKILLIATVIMHDLTYFEQKPEKRKVYKSIN
ncbi:hypothetical protein ABPG72_017539 [Tetrahymena utriculariae]